MSDKRERLETFTTPKGVAVFPKLNLPDTKWKKEGEYGTKLVLPKEAIKPLLEKLEAAAEKALEDAKADLEEKIKNASGAKKGELKKKLSKLERADLPVKPEYDEDGNETDNVVINIKMKAMYKDRKTGKMKRISPKIFDAKGNPLKNPPEIWGGSVLRVNGQIVPFSNPSNDTAGVSLRLSAVQIIELVTRGGGGNAASFGFEAEEGYEADDDDNDSSFKDEEEEEEEEEDLEGEDGESSEDDEDF